MIESLPEDIRMKIYKYHHEMMMNEVLNSLHYYWKDLYYYVDKNPNLYINKEMNFIILI